MFIIFIYFNLFYNMFIMLYSSRYLVFIHAFVFYDVKRLEAPCKGVLYIKNVVMMMMMMMNLSDRKWLLLSQLCPRPVCLSQGPCIGNQQGLAHSRLWDAVVGFLHVFANMQMKLSQVHHDSYSSSRCFRVDLWRVSSVILDHLD